MPPTAVVVPVVQDATDFRIILSVGSQPDLLTSGRKAELCPTTCQASPSLFEFSFNIEQVLHLASPLPLLEASAESNIIIVLHLNNFLKYFSV